MTGFLWYHSNYDGSASVHQDTPEVRARIDSHEGGWFGTPEGAILYGDVCATAFTRKTEQHYDAKAWLRTGAMIPVGMHTVTAITAKRDVP